MMRITSRKNSLLMQVKKLGSSNSARKEQGLWLGEGGKLLGSALDGQAPLTMVVAKDDFPLPDIPEACRDEGFQLIFVPEDVLDWLAPSKTPQGVVFLGKIPETKPPEHLEPGQYLVLDGVQDAGNVGTIWRSAQGLGATGIFLLSGCANPYSPKTLRSAMGASFHLPIWECSGEEAVSLFQASNLPLYATALEENSKKLGEISLKNCAVVIGSEGQGISPWLLSQCAESIYLPMSQGCQSLNAGIAAGIVLWEMGKV